MKKIFTLLFAALAIGASAQTTIAPIKIVSDGSQVPITVVMPNATQPILLAHDGTNRVVSINSLGVLSIAATTNQIVFGKTNSAPLNTSTNSMVWVSVQVYGDTNAYRLPLYK